jgi:hypothetical protein
MVGFRYGEQNHPLYIAAGGPMRSQSRTSHSALSRGRAEGHGLGECALVATFDMLLPQSASWDKPKKKESFTAVKGKDDASLYLFGSFLAGQSSKPLYVIDAKGNWMWHRGDWSLGTNSAISTNASAQTPVNRTRIDPDSITAALSIQRNVLWRAPGIEGFDLNIQPLDGQFSRSAPASDIIGAARVKLVTKPWFGPIRWVAVYPLFGYEGGHNLNRLATLFSQTVNPNWNGISRGLVGIIGEYYWLSRTPSATDTYRLTIDASYQTRVLLEPEPFVSVAAGQSVASVTSGRNPRPEARIAWNFSKYMGLQIEYR